MILSRARREPSLAELIRPAGLADPEAGSASLIGLEQEYSLSRHGAVVDFRTLIHSLAIDGKRLDPGDRNAYRCRSGLVLTCDDAEAEIATPPVAVNPGFTHELERWSSAGRTLIEDLLPPDIEVAGYSTHVSASYSGANGYALAGLFATTFAPALILLMDRQDAFGIYIRPRPGRIEFCMEYVSGAALELVAAFIVGSVRACAAYLAGDAAVREDFPRLLVAELSPCTQRYGIYLQRRAFGEDIFAGGRETRLRLLTGGTLTAQEQLEAAWQAVRPFLATDATPQEVDALGAVVGSSGHTLIPASYETLTPSVFGDLLNPRQRPGFDVSPKASTWDFTVFELHGNRRSAYASVPRQDLRRFLEAIDIGHLDAAIEARLRRRTARAVLESRDQLSRPAVWDRVGDTSRLLPEERGADGNVLDPVSTDSERLGKSGASSEASAAGRRLPWFLVSALIGVVLVGAAGVALGQGNDERPVTQPTAQVAIATVPPPTQALLSPTMIQPAVPTQPVAASPTRQPTLAPTVAQAVQPTAAIAATAPSTASAPAQPTLAANLLAGVGPVSAAFNNVSQTTIYTIVGAKPGLAYAWSGPDCGSSEGASSSSFAWRHPHPPCDPTTQHAGVTVAVIISDGFSRLRCVYQGAAQGVGPACMPQ